MTLSRNDFSLYTMDNFIVLEQSRTAEEIAQLLNAPLTLILERAKEAGIILRRADHFQIARGIPRAVNPAFKQ